MFFDKSPISAWDGKCGAAWWTVIATLSWLVQAKPGEVTSISGLQVSHLLLTSRLGLHVFPAGLHGSMLPWRLRQVSLWGLHWRLTRLTARGCIEKRCSVGSRPRVEQCLARNKKCPEVPQRPHEGVVPLVDSSNASEGGTFKWLGLANSIKHRCWFLTAWSAKPRIL